MAVEPGGRTEARQDKNSDNTWMLNICLRKGLLGDPSPHVWRVPSGAYMGQVLKLGDNV